MNLDEDGMFRRLELDAQDREQAEARKRADEEARKANKDFVQVYPKGWARLQDLIRQNPPAARLYAFLAQHIDGSCGAVVVSQQVLASELDLHERTIRRLSKTLEDLGAVARIRVGGTVTAYALDPSEVWRSWDKGKKLAAFTTRTLVRPSDTEREEVRRKLTVMMKAGPEGSRPR